jgi:hypothetical protein
LHCPITPVAWGVVDMQGWRKSMEDAHVARTDVHIPKHLLQQMMQKQQQQDEGGGGGETAVSSSLPQNVDAKVFGVFDGHGGPEVSRFCQLYLVSVLQHQPTWSEKRGGRAASGSSAAWPLPISATDRITMNEMSTDYRHDSDIGRALRMCFHALDRLIDHPSRRYVKILSRTYIYVCFFFMYVLTIYAHYFIYFLKFSKQRRTGSSTSH